VTVGVNVEVGVAVAVGVSVDVEVAVGGSGLGVADGLPAAGMLQALRTTISGQTMNLGKRSRKMGMAYRQSVGQPKSRSNVPKVAYKIDAINQPAANATLKDIAVRIELFRYGVR
jgi:hypothetical protein